MGQVGPYSGTVGDFTGAINVRVGFYIHRYDTQQLRDLIECLDAADERNVICSATLHAADEPLLANEVHICDDVENNSTGVWDFLLQNSLVIDTTKRADTEKYGELYVGRMTPTLIGARDTGKAEKDKQKMREAREAARRRRGPVVP